ncbi:MAG TPA: hypothetical protein PLV53_09545, partial [Anaerolineaceae bacterium]|nr:hypothetical protein [Anaerolineaceae bacterium]
PDVDRDALAHASGADFDLDGDAVAYAHTGAILNVYALGYIHARAVLYPFGDFDPGAHIYGGKHGRSVTHRDPDGGDHAAARHHGAARAG